MQLWRDLWSWSLLRALDSGPVEESWKIQLPTARPLDEDNSGADGDNEDDADADTDYNAGDDTADADDADDVDEDGGVREAGVSDTTTEEEA